MFDVHEHPTGPEEREDVSIERPFSRVRQVMDRVAGKHEIEWSGPLDAAKPAVPQHISTHNPNINPGVDESLPGGVEHGIGEIHQNCLADSKAIDHRLGRDPVSRTEIQHSLDLD